VHLDAAELSYVYDWRIQQEHELIKLRGSGMTDEDVRAFINGCEQFRQDTEYIVNPFD